MTITRKENEIIGVKSEGHSGYAPIGKDIVCSAVSALLQALLVGIEDVSGLNSELKKEPAFLEIKWDMETAQKVRLLSETVALSLKAISISYPDNVKIVEV